MDTSGRTSFPLFAEGAAEDGQTQPSRQIRFVSPDILRTLGTPLIAGEEFAWTDIHGTREVALISENLSREMWGSATVALGKRIREGNGPWREVVGVTGDIYDEGVHQPPTPTMFLPARMHVNTLGASNFQWRRFAFVVRSERAGTESLLSQIREAVWSVNSNLPLAQVRTLGEVYEQSMTRTAFTLVLLGTAGAMALFLGISGVYGVIAYSVSQRRREIGIRLALGARAPAIRWLVMRRVLVFTGVGMAVGLVGTLGFTRLMRSLLFGVGPFDVTTYVAVAIVLVTAALLASYLPARRAIKVDPMVALRCE
jgi:predicted permease